MPMRMSGLISGLDTDSLISSLVSAKRLKVTKATGEQTKLSWKQDIWKDLNKDLVGLRNTVLNMRYSSAWQKKTTSVSHPNKASVITGSDAVDAVQSLKIDQLAKSGYLTGGVVKAVDSEGKTTGEKLTALSKMSDLGYADGDTTINISTGGTTKSVTFNSESTISDVLSAIKAQGLNASFDEKNQRFFISAKSTGTESDFSITASDANGAKLLDALQISTYDSTAKANLQSFTSYTPEDVAAEALSRAKDAAESYKTLYNNMISAQKKVEDIQKEIDELDPSTEDYSEKLEALNSSLSAAQEAYTNAQDKVTEAQSNAVYDYSNIQYGDDGKISSIDDVSAKTDLVNAVESEFEARSQYAQTQLAALKAGTLTGKATKITGQDAQITLNGATFNSSSNVFNINGLTITALSETADDEEITLTTEADTSGIYDMVKNFLKTYNNIVNQMDKLYNAESSSKYTPLTDEEKEALSESEVEKYEKKIKDGLLKGDSTISSITSALTSIMSSGVEIGGKKVYLSDFGINTQSYFEAEANTVHSYHLDGDSDDTVSSGNADKLKGLIASDPDFVSEFFSKLSQSLYSKMDSLSSRVAGKRTYGSFFEDQTLKSDYTDYKSKIDELEKAANEYEDRLYSKFSKMEAALAKLQSKTSAISGLFGGTQ